MPIEGGLIAPPAPPPIIPGLSYIDRRDTLNRLTRIGVTGTTAESWLLLLNPMQVRQWSDAQLAAFIAGGYVVPGGTGAWGSGLWGAGPWGG